MDAYLLSASVVKRDPANTSFQCPFPQPGFAGLELQQCFWVRLNLISDFDQSVARHVGRFGSKVFTPSRTRSTISTLDFSNSSSKVESQKNVLADNSWRNSSIMGALAKVYDSWFTKPNHDLTSVIHVGTGKYLIAVMIFLSCLHPSRVISKPAKLTSSCVNWNLSLLKTTSLSALSFK